MLDDGAIVRPSSFDGSGGARLSLDRLDRLHHLSPPALVLPLGPRLASALDAAHRRPGSNRTRQDEGKLRAICYLSFSEAK